MGRSGKERSRMTPKFLANIWSYKNVDTICRKFREKIGVRADLRSISQTEF